MQPMMNSNGTETHGSSSLTLGQAEGAAPESNLARNLEPDLLSDIEDVMEESEIAATEIQGGEVPFKAPPVIKVDKRAEELINPAAKQSAEEAAKPKRKRKGPSLFERMTGVGRLSRKVEAERKEAVIAEPTVRREPPATARKVEAEAPTNTVQPQKEEALSSSVRIDKKKEDEDLLDIPAFLRRQAN